MADGIARERELLAPLRERADVVIDTGGLTAAMLRRKLADELLPTRTPGRLAVTFQSFGFKYGPSRDADVMFDVRFLPNPHYEPELRPLTGNDPADRRVHQPRRRAGRASTSTCTRCSTTCCRSTWRRARPTWWSRSAARAAATARWRSPSIWPTATARQRGYLVEVIHRDVTERRERRVIDHIGFEVTDLGRSTRFYDAVFYALGARRMLESEHAVAYGINGPLVWFVVRGPAAGAGYGHLALQASGKAAVDAAYPAGLANGGSDDGPPGQRPAVRPALLRRLPARSRRLRVEVVSRR